MEQLPAPGRQEAVNLAEMTDTHDHFGEAGVAVPGWVVAVRRHAGDGSNIGLASTAEQVGLLSFAPDFRGRMPMAEQPLDLELKMEENDLYQEEIFTDRRVGTIQRLTPIDRTGKPDPARPVLYVGQTQLMSRMGALPLSFEIPGDSLEQAVQNFPTAANGALVETMQKLEDMRRELTAGGPGGPAGPDAATDGRPGTYL